MRDLVVISLEAWDQVWRRNQHLAAGLLREHSWLRMLFVEPPEDPLHGIRSKQRPRLGRGLRDLHFDGQPARLWSYQPTKWLPRRLDRNGDNRWARQVVNAARRIGFRDPLLWVNDPLGSEVLRASRWPTLYDITDDWLAAERPERTLARMREHEEYLIEHGQALVVCSTTLLHKATASQPAILIPNAVDVQAYRAPLVRPADLPSGRIALYVGTLHRDRLDLELCLATSRQLGSAGTLVMVGPVALDAADTASLREAGVQLTGAKPSHEIPAYLRHAEVLVVPHVMTPFTESLDPIKAYEYRAARRPVVSTDVPGFRHDNTGQTRVVDRKLFPTTVRELMTSFISDLETSDVPDWSDRVEDFTSVLTTMDNA